MAQNQLPYPPPSDLIEKGDGDSSGVPESLPRALGESSREVGTPVDYPQVGNMRILT